MSETKFSPEPWKAVSDQRWEAINIVDGNSQLFALVKGEANAALITAAPEMYEGLKEIRDVMEKDGRFCRTVEAIDKLLKKAR